MSTYGNYIETTLKEDFRLIKAFKNDEHSCVELFQNKENNNKLVLIKSKNRNDHIFRALRGHAHPNLPVIFDACSCDDHLIVLESYIDGLPLSEKIKRDTPKKKKAIKYILDICEGLKFLHSLGIIHRDIKPANIIIDKSDTAVLIDLNSARHVSDKQECDTINLGTVGYAAPEQYGIHQSIPATDIYALGVLLNELTINTHPTIQTPSGKLGKIIKKCTETQIYNRYQTIDELISELKRYLIWH
ncbi:MAG: serine/threonine protein kinase [Clostridia bacterium]|nr:serine/threonine protein kinase [Clostridia bacterium]